MDAVTAAVVHVPERRRYELRDGEQVIGAAHYRRRPGQVVFTHTVVDDAYEGQGLGSVLAREALTDVKASGLRIVPVCPFIAAYLRRHHELDDVVDPVPDREDVPEPR
jgi:predicted GNAT family acetyltransferase